MKNKKVFLVVFSLFSIALLGNVVKQLNSPTEDFDLLSSANIVALASGESDCNYTNGYTSFTGGEGGAYDCCKIWRSNAPGGNMCR